MPWALFSLVILALCTSGAEARVQDLLRSTGANTIAYHGVRPVMAGVKHQPDTKKKVNRIKPQEALGDVRKLKVNPAPFSRGLTAHNTAELHSTNLALGHALA